MTKRVILKNTSMLYLLNLAKIVFPFLTFPYLTRVLSVDGYALVMYVRAAMQYMQIGVDFGFMLSATKHIVRAKDNRTRIIAGSKYVEADNLLRLLLPVIVFSFPAMLVGWPALGAINKPEQTSFTTIVAALTQCLGLGLLIICGQFTLYGLAIIRSITEGVLLTGRGWLCFKYKKEFN